MDIAPETTLTGAIDEIALRVDDAKAIEKVLIRKMGSAVYVDLHLEVDPTVSVLEAHNIAHRVKDAISAAQPAVADVLVHVEPHVELKTPS